MCFQKTKNYIFVDSTTSDIESLQESWMVLWHQQHHQSIRPSSVSHSSLQIAHIATTGKLPFI